MLGRHSAIVIPRDTPYAQEMQKHEAYPSEFGPGKRPYVYREFPKMIYRATRKTEGVGIDFEGFIVKNDDEQRNMQSRGYAVTQQDALDALNREQTEHGKLAAERNFEVAKGRISEKAAAEVRAHEEDHGSTHMPVVPETPIKRRTRGPNKPKTVSA